MATIAYRLKPKAGSHVEGSGKNSKTYKAGDVVKSDKDLAALFPFKFEKVELIPGVDPEAKIPQVVEKSEAPATEPAQDQSPAKPKGKDVTERFPSVMEQDFLVFAVTGGLNVYDADDTREPLNDKPLKRGQVKPFVEKFLKG